MAANGAVADARSVLSLRIEVPGGAAEELKLVASEPIVIGRDASCHVVLPSPDVSRKHVELSVRAGTIYLRDTSSNGTIVGKSSDKLRHSKMQLPPGTSFRVGPYLLYTEIHENRPITEGHEAPGWNPSAQTGYDSGMAPMSESESARPADGSRADSPRSESARPSGRPSAATPPLGSSSRAQPSRRSSAATSEGRTAAKGKGKRPKGKKRPRRSGDAPKKGQILKYARPGTVEVESRQRRRIHQVLLDHLDLVHLDRSKMSDKTMRPKVRQALVRIIRDMQAELPETTDIANLIEELADEALGLGPLEALLADENVTEVMVVDDNSIFIEQRGKLLLTDLCFTDGEALRAVIERIVTPLGRRIDESSPLVDARLADGSRVNAVIPPLAIRGPSVTIRKFPKKRLKLTDLEKFGSVTERMGRFLTRCVISRKNIVVSGGTGSGKTTLLNVLSEYIPSEERIITIEDAAELRLHQPHVVPLESKPPNMEGKGAVTIRDLVRNALRMRPDRIIVGECRGGEALDMLQAMNTGHDGSMTTTHANSPFEAMQRLETLSLMAGLDLPSRAIREQIAASVDVVVQCARLSDGSRRITGIAEVIGLDDTGRIELRDIFKFVKLRIESDGELIGEFRATGYLPSFIEDFIVLGLVPKGDFV